MFLSIATLKFQILITADFIINKDALDRIYNQCLKSILKILLDWLI